MAQLLPFDARRVDLFLLAEEPSGSIGLTTEYLVTTLLGRNVSNRHVRRTHVAFMADTIKRGAWTLTPNGIGLTRSGILIDGQHRLLAIQECGYPSLPLLVMFGLDPAASAAIDLGIRRSVADLMHFAFGHPEMTSAMIAVTRSWAENTGLFKIATRPHAADICDWYMTIQPSLDSVFAIAGVRGLSAPVLAAVVHRLHRVPEDLRPLTFVEKLVSGANLPENSPVLRLRNYLADTKRMALSSTVTQERFQRTATALIAFLEGRQISRLYMREDVARLLADVPPSSDLESAVVQ